MLKANVLAFLIPVAVLVATVFSPTEVFGANRKQHLKKPSRHLLEISQSGPKRAAEQASFSQRLFKEQKSQEILELTSKSVFIRGMESGTLNANYYGAHMVQDIAYLAYGVDAYRLAAYFVEEAIFKNFYKERAIKWKTVHLKGMLTDWHVKDAKQVALGNAAKTYVNFLHGVSKEKPKYLAIAMLPCSMLWRSLANQLIENVSKTSAYYTWFQQNESHYKGTLEGFVDKHFDQFDFEFAKYIFLKAMTHECSFFRESGKEDPCIFPSNFK